MTNKSESLDFLVNPISSTRALRDCVRRALCLRHARWHAVVVAAGIASVTPLALGAAFPPVFPLASLYPAAGGDGSRGFVLAGVRKSDYSGTSVSSAGDINGDGMDDVIVGAFGADPDGVNSSGASYVVFGRSAAQ